MILSHALRASSGNKKLQFLASYANTTSQSTFTFNSVDFGTTAYNRTIIVVVVSRTATARTITSCTIGGVTANLTPTTTSTNVPNVIASVNLTSGTSGTVVVNANGAIDSGCAIGVYACYGLNSVTAQSSGRDGVSAATSRTVTLSTQSSDFIFAGLLLASNETVTWTNVTQNSTIAIGNSRQVYFASNSNSPSGSVAVSASWTPSITNGLVAANFR